MLFDEYTLRDAYHYIEQQKAEIVFAKFVYYKSLSYPIKLIEGYLYPQNTEAYNNPNTLRESYLLNHDIALTPTSIWKRNTLIEYMTEISESEYPIKYCEDYAIFLVVFDKRKVSFLNRNTAYYEVGGGIFSGRPLWITPKQKAISSIVGQDTINRLKIMKARCEASISDEFSQRLLNKINGIFNDIEYNRTHPKRPTLKARIRSLKWKLGIFAVPLVIIKRSYEALTKPFRKPPVYHGVMTDMNVSTDFANRCMTQE